MVINPGVSIVDTADADYECDLDLWNKYVVSTIFIGPL